jgi:hypothetical protein
MRDYLGRLVAIGEREQRRQVKQRWQRRECKRDKPMIGCDSKVTECLAPDAQR